MTFEESSIIGPDPTARNMPSLRAQCWGPPPGRVAPLLVAVPPAMLPGDGTSRPHGRGCLEVVPLPYDGLPSSRPPEEAVTGGLRHSRCSRAFTSCITRLTMPAKPSTRAVQASCFLSCSLILLLDVRTSGPQRTNLIRMSSMSHIIFWRSWSSIFHCMASCRAVALLQSRRRSTSLSASC